MRNAWIDEFMVIKSEDIVKAVVPLKAMAEKISSRVNGTAMKVVLHFRESFIFVGGKFLAPISPEIVLPLRARAPVASK